MSIRIIQLLVVLLVFAGDLYFGQAQSINIVDENGKQIIRTDAVLKRGTTYLPVEILSLVFVGLLWSRHSWNKRKAFKKNVAARTSDRLII